MSESALIPAPPPGIYYDVPAAEYFKWDAFNASTAKKLVASGMCPEIVRYELDHPKPPTPSMLQGSVCHTQLFEPDKIASRYVVSTECCAITGKGVKCDNNGKMLSGGGWYCGVHSRGKSPDTIPSVLTEDGEIVPAVITEEMLVKAQQMAIRARWDNKIRDLLTGGASFEVCIVWVDPVVELLCKARLDVYKPYQIADLKSCQDASEEGFSKTIGDLGYDVQAAMYLDAATSLDGVEHEDFVFIAQMSEPPYTAAAWRIGQQSVALGRHRYRRAMADWKACKENNVWPGFHDNLILPINVTRFFFERESRK